MESALYPTFMTQEKYSYLLKNMDLFKDLCLKFADKVKHGKDPAVKILTEITESFSVKGLPPLDILYDFVKKAAFEIRGTSFIGPRHYDTDHQQIKVAPRPKRNRWHKFLQSDQSEMKTRLLLEKLDVTLEKHKKLCLKYTELRKCMLPCLNGKTEIPTPKFTVDEETADNVKDDLERSVKEKTVTLTDEWCDIVKAILGEFKDVATESWRLFLHEKIVREETLEPLEEEMYKIAYDRIYKTINDGITALIQGCKIAELPNDFIDELESYDCEKNANQLVYLMSVKYHYPDLLQHRNSLLTPVAYFKHPDVKELKKGQHYRGYRQWNLAGSNDNLLADDILCDFPRENIYVTANEKVKGLSQGELKLKKGMKIKQKLVSCDGKTGFGWTRHFRGGPKTYGFYPIKATT